MESAPPTADVCGWAAEPQRSTRSGTGARWEIALGAGLLGILRVEGPVAEPKGPKLKGPRE